MWEKASNPLWCEGKEGKEPSRQSNLSPQELPMNTSTSLQALAALAVGSALLISATPADAARGGFRSAPVRSAPVRAASFTRAPVRAASFSRTPAPTFRFNRPTLQRQVAPVRGIQPASNSVRRSNARGLFSDVGNAIGGGVKAI